MNLDKAIEQLEEIVAQVRETSLSDDKTPLGNALALSKEVDFIKIGRSEFDVIVFGDLNDFKTLNDEYGHEAGDLAIERIGKKIQTEFVHKLKAKAFRQSGDEFIILLRQNTITSFQTKTSLFKSVKFRYKEKSLKAKMSFGLIVSDGKTDFSDMLKHAETACLTAKNQGDGVCIEWTEEVERNALKELRRNCRKCGSVNKCSIPKQLNPERLKLCAYCGEKLNS